MKKRNQKICDMQANPGSKILCAKFGNYTKTKFASGDDKNNVQIWKLGTDKPLVTLNHQSVTNQTACVEVSAICFGVNEEDLFSGSNRGIINVWDLSTLKQSQTLKGHVAAISAISTYQQDELKNLIISGAYDTLIKLWDLRQRNQTAQFKGHTAQINCIQISPDGKIMASGSHDGTVKIWDISSPSKPITTFIQHDAPVTCMKYNPVDKALASGGNDRIIKYWDLDSYSIITSTRPDATPIQSIVFDTQGKYVFAAAHESLKIWNLEKDGQLLDNIESNWRGVMDLCVQEDENQLLGLAAQGQQGFGLYCLSLQLVNFDGKASGDRQSTGGNNRGSVRGRTPDQRSAPQISNPIINYQLQNPIIPVQQQGSYMQQHQEDKRQSNNQANIKPKPHLAQQARNIITYEPTYSTNQPQSLAYQQPQPQGLPLVSQSPQLKKQNTYPNAPNQNYYPPVNNQQDQYLNQETLQEYRPTSSHSENQLQMMEQANKYYDKEINPTNQPSYSSGQMNQAQHQQQKIPQVVQNLTQSIFQSGNEADEEVKVPDYAMQEEQDLNSQSDLMMSNADLNFSAFIHGESKDKFKQLDQINDVTKEHIKVMQILKSRQNYMKPILHWWNSGNIKSAINAINQIQEASILLDALQMVMFSPKFTTLNMELVPPLLEKSKILIDSKYMSHIKGGLEFVRHSLGQFKDEIISMKQFTQLSKADLAREERLQKCDKIIESMKTIVNLPKIQKIIDRNKEEISDIAKKLQSELLIFIKRSSQNQI